jgi:hypothetical protein
LAKRREADAALRAAAQQLDKSASVICPGESGWTFDPIRLNRIKL